MLSCARVALACFGFVIFVSADVTFIHAQQIVDDGEQPSRAEPRADQPQKKSEAESPPEAADAKNIASKRAGDPQDTEAGPSLTPRQIYEKVSAGVVVIRTEGGIGAGFLAKGDRFVATAFHVIEGGGPISVIARTGRSYEARVYSYDKDHDLAVLMLERDFEDTVPLPLAPAKSISVGDPVVAIGHPFGAYSKENQFKGLLTWTVTYGVVGAISDKSIQTDAAINPGNSGGPLLDELGRVAAVVSSKLRDAQSVGFAVPAVHLQALLDQERRSPPLKPPTIHKVGIGINNLETLEGLWMNGLQFSLLSISSNRSIRTGGSVGYNSVKDIPESGEALSFSENMYWIQLEAGPRFSMGPLGHIGDLVLGLRLGWWEREQIDVSAYTDPSCNEVTEDVCGLDLKVDKLRSDGFKVYGLGALVVPIYKFHIGAGGLFDPVEKPRARWVIWLSLIM